MDRILVKRFKYKMLRKLEKDSTKGRSKKIMRKRKRMSNLMDKSRSKVPSVTVDFSISPDEPHKKNLINLKCSLNIIKFKI